MKKLSVIFNVMMAIGLLAGAETEIEPFTAGESKAIEIYEIALPILEAGEELFANKEVEITFDDVEELAEEREIDLEPIEDAVVDDPNMANFALDRLKGYSSEKAEWAASVKEDKEFAEALDAAAVRAEKHAAVLEILLREWAPEQEVK